MFTQTLHAMNSIAFRRTLSLHMLQGATLFNWSYWSIQTNFD